MRKLEHSEEPLTGPENAKIRRRIARDDWWEAFWVGLATLAGRLKVVSGLLPWLIGLVVLIGPDRLREFFGW